MLRKINRREDRKVWKLKYSKRIIKNKIYFILKVDWKIFQLFYIQYYKNMQIWLQNEIKEKNKF